jgi:hypothetical protein
MQTKYQLTRNPVQLRNRRKASLSDNFCQLNRSQMSSFVPCRG